MIQRDGFDILRELIAQQKAEEKRFARTFLSSLAKGSDKSMSVREIIGLLVPDKIYPGTDVPERVRKEMIAIHLLRYGGPYCPVCKRFAEGRSKLSVDHINPIDNGGPNSRRNLRVICLECNRKKGAKLPFSLWI